MSQRGRSLLALSALFAALSSALLGLVPRRAPAAPGPLLSVTPSARASAPPVTAADAARPASRFELLPPLHFVNQSSRETRDVRLYGASGEIDEAAASALDQLLGDTRKPHHHETTTIRRRTLQLLFKAAYHFGATEVLVVSGYRKPGRHREGPHGTGAAVDFRLPGVDFRELAAYLRQIPRTGVGVYTHPKTQYVHLDSREQSYHWLDASPPGRHWRERSIGGAGLQKRDALYSAEQDWP